CVPDKRHLTQRGKSLGQPQQGAASRRLRPGGLESNTWAHFQMPDSMEWLRRIIMFPADTPSFKSPPASTLHCPQTARTSAHSRRSRQILLFPKPDKFGDFGKGACYYLIVEIHACRRTRSMRGGRM